EPLPVSASSRLAADLVAGKSVRGTAVEGGPLAGNQLPAVGRGPLGSLPVVDAKPAPPALPAPNAGGQEETEPSKISGSGLGVPKLGLLTPTEPSRVVDPGTGLKPKK